MKNIQIILFSEGSNYFSTFKPIIDQFLENNIDFKYYSFDKYDPIFSLFENKIKYRYLGKGFFSYLRFSFIDADYLISTTPNIGTPGYPIKKPKNVKNLIHIFHSISDISIYKKGSLDNYDIVFLAGKFQINSIRYLEQKRELKSKELISIGVPYLEHLTKNKIEQKSDGNTILIASSWSKKGCLIVYGIDFIINLVKDGYNIIVRPHPQSYISEPDYISYCKKKLSNFSNVEWDDNKSPIKSMSKADLLISDTSSIRFDYYFLYKKPIITLIIDDLNMNGYEYEELKIKDTLYNDIFGITIKENEIDSLPKTLKFILNSNKLYDSKNKINDLQISNINNSSKKIVEYFKNKILNNEH